METLQFEDTQKLHQGIQQLYMLRDRDTFKVDALRIVDRLVPSDLPLFHVTNTRTGELSLTYLPNFSVLAPRLVNVLTTVLREDRHNHPIAQHMPQTLGGAYKLSDFVSRSELHCHAKLYQQFLRPLDIEDQMLLFLPDVRSLKWDELARSNITISGFIIDRSSRNFTERDRTILNLLRPHLAQADANVQHYHQLLQQNDRLQQSLNHLGAIFLDSELRIVSIAPQAIIWLETYFTRATCSHDKLPDRLQSWLRYQIDCLTKNSDLPNVCLPLRIQHTDRELTIRLTIEPQKKQYMLLLAEQTLSSLNSLALLGLSQREAEVLKLIIQGEDNKDIATRLSVNISTIRKHLENIYGKFKVKSRTEAIAHALTKLGIL
jgi:DNA-binding CsgD family transcriptional regulator